MIPLLMFMIGCGVTEEHGHSHGTEHAHADDNDAIALTRWTENHELCVEFDAPTAGHPVAYHAHVTRLDDNQPATTGTLTVTFEDAGFVVESHTDTAVARAGIFASHAVAPSKPGKYGLRFVYANTSERAEWDGGTVIVADAAPAPHDDEPQGEIAFTKELQWQVPFAVHQVSERALSTELIATGIVQPAPSVATVVAAPVDGLFAWTDGLVAVGSRVTEGDRLATLIPAGSAEHWSRLQADLVTARVHLRLSEQELARVVDLADRDLLSEKRRQEAKAAMELADAEVTAAQRKARMLTTDGAGSVAITAPVTGLIVAGGVAHGSPVHAADPLFTVSTGPATLIEGRVHQRATTDLSQVTAVWVARGDWDTPAQLPAASLLTHQLVFDETLSAPVSVLATDDVGLAVGDLVELHLTVGEPEPRLAIPRSSVVEINGRDVVFVQVSGESFTRRRVTLGMADPSWVEIRSGLKAGERVVAEGGFDVHVASLSGALESHRH